MAEQDPGSRHALQYKGQVKSFSSKDILAQLAAAQTQSATHSEARTAAPPSQSAAPPVPVSVATPPKGDAKATNFHALQYTGQVKKFTSSSVLQQFTHATAGGINLPADEPSPSDRERHAAASSSEPPVPQVDSLIDLDTPGVEPPPPPPTATTDPWGEFLASTSGQAASANGGGSAPPTAAPPPPQPVLDNFDLLGGPGPPPVAPPPPPPGAALGAPPPPSQAPPPPPAQGPR